MARNYTITTGASCNFEHQCLNSLGEPVDLTGWTIEADLRDRPGEPVLLSFALYMPSPTTGVFNLLATPAETTPLSSRRSVYYDIKFTRPDSSVHYSPRISLNIKTPITV